MMGSLSTNLLPPLPDLVIEKILSFIVEGTNPTDVVKCFEIIDAEILVKVRKLYDAMTEIYMYMFPIDSDEFSGAFRNFMEDSILESVSSFSIQD